MVCTNYETQTVTVTETYAPASGETGAPYQPGSPYQSYTPAQSYGSYQTITVTKTAPPVTITESVTLNGGSYMSQTWGMTGTGSSPSTTASVRWSNTTSSIGSKKTHHVEVGTFNGKVQFVPDQLDADIGDVILYDFLAKSHSLTQSDFHTPCTYNGGFNTGLNQPNPNNITGLHVIPLEVTTKSPQWFYCEQPGPPNHCGLGMVFGLNPAGKMDQFIQNAIAQNGNLTTTSPPATNTTASSTSSTTGSIYTVTVGLNNGTSNMYDPPFLPKVLVGDVVHFDFRAKNHTLTESSFGAPCTKLDGTDVDTNFQNVNIADIPNAHPFDLTVTSDEPRFFYCKQKNGTPEGHCAHDGMVFGLNIDGTTFSQFQHNAEATLPKIKGRGVRVF